MAGWRIIVTVVVIAAAGAQQQAVCLQHAGQQKARRHINDLMVVACAYS